MIIIIKIAEKQKKLASNFNGATSQTQNTSIRLILGPKKKISLWALPGEKWVFKNSFTASAIGCNNPAKEGLLGPSRLWEYPKIFRSKRVINAMLISTITRKIK